MSLNTTSHIFHRVWSCSSPETRCVNPNLTILWYTNRYHDNYLCNRTCSQLPGGRLAVPINQEQLDCFLKSQREQVNASLWTGVRVRQSGELYDPLTNMALKDVKDTPTLFHSDHLMRENVPKSRKCIFLDDRGFFFGDTLFNSSIVQCEESSDPMCLLPR